MSNKQPAGFPRNVAIFTGLRGGQWGTMNLVALTRHRLELQLGNDFIQFDRHQAKDLRDAVQTFIDFEREAIAAAEARVEGEVAVAEAVVAEAVAEHEHEARTRKRART